MCGARPCFSADTALWMAWTLKCDTMPELVLHFLGCRQTFMKLNINCFHIKPMNMFLTKRSLYNVVASCICILEVGSYLRHTKETGTASCCQSRRRHGTPSLERRGLVCISHLNKESSARVQKEVEWESEMFPSLSVTPLAREGFGNWGNLSDIHHFLTSTLLILMTF